MAETPGRLAGRIALITGASRGIGAAVARRFAAEGAQLVLVARTVGALEEIDDDVKAASGRNATLVPMDLRDGEKIDQLGAAIYERFGRLDVLVGNAGLLGTLTPVAHVTPSTWDDVVSVNLTANWRLIRSCDPLLRSSESGRAMFVTSGAARGAFPYWGPYAATKAALETLVLTYAAEMEKTSVRINIVDPGVVRTGMRASAFPGEDPSTLPPPETLGDVFVDLASAESVRHGDIVRA